MTLLDVSENGLAAALRDVRSNPDRVSGIDVQVVLSDLTSVLGAKSLAMLQAPDVIFHLAAVKHVRSETNEASLARMLAVNVGSALAVQDATNRVFPEARVIAVSTDKAAQPRTLMGASKRLMEIALLNGQGANVARFPNVAFSPGSLLESWQRRISLDEPLPVPRDTRRFLINPVEAADMCLAALGAEPNRLVIPREGCLTSVELLATAHRYLECIGRPEYPVVLTEREVETEKADECFVSEDESATAWLAHLATISQVPDDAAMRELWAWISGCLNDPSASIIDSRFSERLASVIPQFRQV